MLEEHDHFMCERCSTVSDLARKRSAPPSAPDLGRAGYVVRSHALTFYGVCPKCRTATDTKRAAPALR